MASTRPASAPWDPWFVNLFSLAYERNIKAISFINEDWERFNFPGVSWGDARLQNNPRIADAWFAETNKDRYLKQSQTSSCSSAFNPEPNRTRRPRPKNERVRFPTALSSCANAAGNEFAQGPVSFPRPNSTE